MTAMRTKLVLLGMTAILLVACETRVQQQGHPPLAEMEALLTPDVKTREDVLRVLGSPSTSSDFGPLTWYYISVERESVAFFAPETVRQDVLRIQFSEDGEIAKVDHTNLDDAQDVQISDRVTPTEGHKLGFVEQIIGNVGRFNGSKKATGPKSTINSGRPGAGGR